MLSLEGWAAAANDPAYSYGIRIPAQVSTSPYAPLVVPLTPEQIEVIEDQRRGDAVILKITLGGLAVLPNVDVQTVHQAREHYGGEFRAVTLEQHDFHRVTTQGDTSIRIEREQWLRILEQLGAGKRRLVELPELNFPDEQSRWDECTRRLSEATQHHRHGEFEQTLEQCRKVVEGIATVLGNVWHVPKQSDKSFEAWTKELSSRMTKAWQSDKEAPKMLAALLSAAYTWTSPTAHYGSDIPVREESSFGLSAASDLLTFAAQLVNAHPNPVVPTSNP